MGARGPVPKRSSERRRQNKESEPEKVKPKAKKPAAKGKEKKGKAAPAAPAEFERRPAKRTWHPIAKEWYDSLEESGQAQFFEPSDWTSAFYVAEVMSRHLKAKRLSAQLFASIWSAMGELLSTEGARRRVRIEIEREEEETQPAGVTAIAEYRERVASGN